MMTTPFVRRRILAVAFASLWLASANCSTTWVDTVRAKLALRMLQEVARAAYAMNCSLTFADPGNIRARFPYRRNAEGPVIGAFRIADGGSAEIRTLGRVSPSAVFKTAAFNHSATLPDKAGAIVPDRNTLSNTDARHPTCLCYDPGQIVSGLNSSKECRHARTRIRA